MSEKGHIIIRISIPNKKIPEDKRVYAKPTSIKKKYKRKIEDRDESTVEEIIKTRPKYHKLKTNL